MDVNEALTIHQEGQEFLESFAAEDRAEAAAMLRDDTQYFEAYTYLSALGELAAAARITSEEHGVADISDAPQEPENINDLLAELEDVEHQAELTKLAEQQKEDIDNSHSMLSDLNRLQASFGRRPTKKQNAEWKRCLRRAFRERWTAEELADQPHRLKTVLESMLCKDGVREVTRDGVLEHIRTEVVKYVKTTERTTTPDVIADRFVASFSPGLASQQLKETLVKPYIQEGERHDIEGVLNNYERLVRATLRVSDRPDICKQAILTAGFQTELLPGRSLYSGMIQAIPRFRLDQPSLFGYSMSCLRALNVLRIHHDVEFVMSSRGNIYTEANATIQQSIESGRLTDEQYRALESHFGRVGLQHGSIAVMALGAEEFQRRMLAMEMYTEQLNGEAAINRFIEEFGSRSRHQDVLDEVPHLADIAVEAVCEEMPDMRDFLLEFTNADYEVLHELPNYVPDMSSNLTNIMRASRHSVIDDIGSSVDAMYETLYEDPETAEQLREQGYEPGMSFLDSMSQMRTDEYVTDDGYVVTVMSSANDPEITTAEWEDLLEYYKVQLEEGRQIISETTGQRRKSHIISDPELGLHVTIRPESEEDRRAFHPIDKLLNQVDKVDESDVKLFQSIIEDARQKVLLERRRFLNSRGIRYNLDGDDSLGISIVKHPKNPQYYICTFDVQSDEHPLRVQVLMNHDLQFQLGNKRVRSKEKLLAFNAVAAELLTFFMCADALDTEEGPINDEKNALVSRIAHLRLLPEGQHYSPDRWRKCLEVEGEDLEVLSRLQQLRYHTSRNSTYVQAVENDDSSKGPLLIYMPTNEA